MIDPHPRARELLALRVPSAVLPCREFELRESGATGSIDQACDFAGENQDDRLPGKTS